jgi:hypothetical protein
MALMVRGLAPFALAIALVAAVFVLTAGDLAYVALVVMSTAFIVGGAGSGSLVARALVYGGLASLALVGFSAIASAELSLAHRVADGLNTQRFTPLWSMPLAAFGVWAGHDFRRSLEEIAAGR